MRYRFLRFPEGKLKAVTFSYDDGCRADIKLSALLSKYGLKGTFNLNSAWLGKSETDWHLTPEEIKTNIIDRGHEIAVHGALHKANGNIRAVEGIKDVLDCRVVLEDTFDTIVRGLAYPDSGIRHFHNNTKVKHIAHYLKELDIKYARTLGEINDTFDLPSNWYQWMPTAHHDEEVLPELIDRFVDYKVPNYHAIRHPKLMYIWGHAYEFDDKNNWDKIEAFCQKLSGKEDTWYATNIEIYEYIEAYHSLVFSADSTRIYNPTVKKIWFEVDAAPYSIEPGETIKIK